jgi:hypothetical protein
MTHNPTQDANVVGGDATVMQIDGAIEPIVPEVLVMGEAKPNSLDVYAGAIYWTTDPVTAKGQVQKLTPGGTPQVLAAQEDHPISIDVGPGFIEDTAFWGLDTLLGQVRQIATSGAPPLSSVAVNDVVYSLTLDGDSVFFGTRSAVKSKCRANSCSPVNLATGYGNGVLAIAADATGVVYGTRTTSGSWIVASVPRTGGTPLTLFTGTEAIRDIAIVGSNVVFLNYTEVMRVPRGGGAPSTVATITEDVPWRLTTDGSKLFVATNQGVINPSGATGKILEIDPISGATKELAKDQAEPADIAVDSNYIYWLNRGLGTATGQIVRLKR